MTQINAVMTRNVRLARPDETLQDAARTMAEADVGSLPVGEGDRLVGMITDRDIVIRGVAAGHGVDTKVSAVMTTKIRYCFDDEDVDTVAKNMAELGIRRLPVVDRERRLVGIVAFSNIVHGAHADAKKALIDGVAQPH
jgi:CBS domain-containing protein